MNQVSKKQSLGNFLNFANTKKFLEDALNDKKKEFVSNLLALADADAKLAQCEPKKLMMCAMNATALNLPLSKSMGYAYIIPYKGVPSFQIGYKGWIQLALRTGQYEFLNAVEVRKDEMERNKFTGEIKFLGEFSENDIIGYVAYLKLKSGFKASVYMTASQMEAHAKRYSETYKWDIKNKTRKSKWSDPVEKIKMAKKTVLKGLLSTYGVISTEMQRAMDKDQEVDETNDYRDISDLQDKPETQTDKPDEKEVDLSKL